MKSLLARFLLNTFFPESCPVCRGKTDDPETAPVCQTCWRTIEPFNGPVCTRCGRPFAATGSTVCGDCLLDEPAFSYARSYGRYDGALRKAIHLFKYYGIKRFSKPLSDIILAIEPPYVDAIVPVPLHGKRLREREFNQSALLAACIAKRRGTGFSPNCLIKIRDTSAQVGLSLRERIDNVKGSFTVGDRKCIKGKRIMLVDDVITTGSTVRECSRVLKRAGAADVCVTALARGVYD